MHWRFDPLFSLTVYHSKFDQPVPDTWESPRPAPDFMIEPTTGTAALLKKNSWLCKQGTGSCVVYAEKIIDAAGNSDYRNAPTAGTAISFVLRLTNNRLLNETKPFVVATGTATAPNKNLPTFSGAGRILYFDNRNVVYGNNAPYPLTAGATDIPNLASRSRLPFVLSGLNPGSSVSLSALTPSGSTVAVPSNPVTNSVEIDVPENGYQISGHNGGTAETIYLTNDRLPVDCLGIIRIFIPAANLMPAEYTVMFDQS